MTDIRAAIHRRISVRHYQERPVAENILKDVITSAEESIALDSSIPVRFHLFKEGKLVAKRMTPLTGTRLLFGSSPHFIICTELRILFP